MNEQNKLRPKNLLRVLAILAVFLSAFSFVKAQPTNYCRPDQGPSTWPITYYYCWPMYYVQYGYYPYYGSIIKEVNIFQGSTYYLSSITSNYSSAYPYQGGPTYDDPNCYKFFDSPQPQLSIGETYSFQIKIAPIYGFQSYYCSSTQYTMRLFVDWNMDGDFVDQNPDEWINHPGGSYASPSWQQYLSSWCPSSPNLQTFTYNIKIPDNLDPGKTRMRVMSAYYYPYYGDWPLPDPKWMYGYYNPYGADACHNAYMYDYNYFGYGYGYLYSYGESEDYILDLSLPLKATFPDNVAPNDILYAGELYNGTTRTRYDNEGNPYNYYYEKPYVEFYSAQPSGTQIKYSIQGPLPSTNIVYKALNPSGGDYINVGGITKYVVNKATGIYAPGGNGDFKGTSGGEYNLIITLRKPNGTEKSIIKRFTVSWPYDLAVSEVVSPQQSGPPRFYKFPPKVPVTVSAVYQNVGVNPITKFDAYADIYRSDGSLFRTLSYTYDTVGGIHPVLAGKQKVTIDFGTFTSDEIGTFSIVFRADLKSAVDYDSYNNRFPREGDPAHNFIIAAPVEIAALKMNVPSDSGTVYSGRAFTPQGTVINNGVNDVSNVQITFRYRKITDPPGTWIATINDVLADVPAGRYNTSIARWAGQIIKDPGTYFGSFKVTAAEDYDPSNDEITFVFTVIGGLSGTVRVGVGQDYETIPQFTNELYKRGMSGDLNVELTDKTYDLFSPFEDAPAWDLSSYIVGLGNYDGKINRLTFKPSVERSKERGSIEIRMHSFRGDGVRFGQNLKPNSTEAPIYYAPSLEHIRQFANTPGYITFDGGSNKSMKFILYSASQIQGRAFSLQRGSHHITLKNLLIENATPAIKDDYEIPRMKYTPSEGFTFNPDSLILVDTRLGYSAGISNRATLTPDIYESKTVHVDTVQNSNNRFSNNEINGFGYGIVSLGIGPLINPRNLLYTRYYNLSDTIDGNIIYDVERSGIFLGFEENALVKQNRIYNAQGTKSDKNYGIEMGFETGTYGFGYNNVGVILDGNEISEIKGKSLSAGISAFQDGQYYPSITGGMVPFPNTNENFKFYNNIIRGISNTSSTGERYGILVMTNRGSNMFSHKNADQAIKNVLVSNNTIYLENDGITNTGNQAGIGLFDVLRGRIYNNAIALTDPSISKNQSLFDAAIVYNGIYPSDAGLRSDYNVFWIPDKTNWSTYRFYQIGGTTRTTNYVYAGYHNEFRDLEQWQMWTGEDKNSFENVNFTNDYFTTTNLPTYMRIKNNPYPTGSILNNRGKNLSDYTTDIAGNIRGDGGFAYDIGACEFNGIPYLRDLEADLIISPGSYRETTPLQYSEAEYIMTAAPVEVVTRIFNGGGSVVVNSPINVNIQLQTPDGNWQPYLQSSANISRILPYERQDIPLTLADGVGDEFVPKTYYELNQEGMGYTIPPAFECMKENVTPVYRITVTLDNDLNNANNQATKDVRFFIQKAGYKAIVSSPSDLSAMPSNPNVNDIATRLNYTALQNGLLSIGFEKDLTKNRQDYDYFNRSAWEPRAVNYTPYRTLFWTEGDAEYAAESYMYTPGHLNSLINFLDAGKSNEKKNIVVASQELIRMHNSTNVGTLLSDYLRASDKSPSNPMGQGVSYDQKLVKGVAISRNLEETIQKTGYTNDKDPYPGLLNLVQASTGYSQIAYIYESLGSYADPNAPNSERIMGIATSTLGYNSVLFGVDWRHFASLNNLLRATVDYLNEYGGNVVPIELLSFDAEPVGNRVEVRWITGSEKGSSYFEVEKREVKNGISTEYATLEKVKATGESINEVHYGPVYDRNVKYGGEYVYRLKMVDKDGAMKYSDEKTVRIDKGNTNLWMSEVSPNPVKGQVNVQVSLSDGNAIMIVYDLNGRELIRQSISNSGINQELSIDVSTLPAGTYTLTLKSGEQIVTRNFTIMR